MIAFNIDQFESQIEDDFTWRIKEMSTLVTCAQVAENKDKSAIIRSTIPIIYAHWEGFVKFSAEKYLEYISTKRMKYRNLKSSFIYLAVDGTCKEIQHSSPKRKIELIWDIIASVDKTNKDRHNKKISTKSNLRFDVLEEICVILSLHHDEFKQYEHFINSDLCDGRNRVAHGRNFTVDIDRLKFIRDKSVEIMRIFKNQTINSAATNGFTV
ncbi:MAE_28990/MAE_18760 family HEPN-like nuclease [Nitrospirillum iridis]|uniref:MAE-28990/MAE-18760-like HEPN domain-containing protein n=1 Tax=Nitrospirillum iridis TaxID=765888 RepID=A0A7X0AXY2_9PROT|nr:MAE_28990/MAE_18760 family HEPN-like nuclease [Nitrospirillum iridis]MBB6250716.1 hypothetical protein [Nitrospirillum iridis]